MTRLQGNLEQQEGGINNHMLEVKELISQQMKNERMKNCSVVSFQYQQRRTSLQIITCKLV